MKPEERAFLPTPIDEQETTINLDYRDWRAYVYTSRVQFARKLLRMCNEHMDDIAILKQSETGLEVSVPMDWITVRPKKKHTMTEEQKKAASERFAAALAAKKAGESVGSV